MTIKKQYTQMLRLHRNLKVLSGNTNDWAQSHWDAHHRAQAALSASLALILRNEALVRLTRKQLCIVLALCSAYRPQAPHTILLYFSMAAEHEGWL